MPVLWSRIDHGPGLGSELKMLVLDDPGVGSLPVRIVHHRNALVVLLVQHFGLKAQGPVLQLAEAVAEIGVDGAGVDHRIAHRVVAGLILQVIHTRLDRSGVWRLSM